MTSNARLGALAPTAAEQARQQLSPTPAMIVVGKDVLELLSSAMYVDPLSIYREYVQNAADAIDEARLAGLLDSATAGKVDISIDAGRRSIAIRDNGHGIANAEAPRRLLAIGASTKRGTRARGFRGVGRLAGLAYARSLTFRTRAAGDDEIVELRWDCQRLKAALRDIDEKDDVGSVIQRVVSVARLPGDEWPEHFFEVELSDVIRTKRDELLSPSMVRHYLEQVAPVPFHPSFSWAKELEDHLQSARLGNLSILINDEPEAVTRPFRDRFMVSNMLGDELTALETIELGDLDGGTAAVGWILHHAYLGSITPRSRIGGFRVRVGNVQVGDHELLADVFPEPRFNGWTVGEIHILDPRILPNARRDNFEQNVHYSNFTAQLEPLARRIARRARAASIARNNERRTIAASRPSERIGEPAADHLHPGPEARAARASPLGDDQLAFLDAVRQMAKERSLTIERARDALRSL